MATKTVRAFRSRLWAATCRRASTASQSDSAPQSSLHHGRKEAFVRDRPHLNLATVGASRHGKTTLSSAITRRLASNGDVPFRDIRDIYRQPNEMAANRTEAPSHFEWWTDVWRVMHTDLPGDFNFFKNIIAHLALLDVVVLVVLADEGVAPETLTLYHVAKHMGVPTVIPFVNATSSTEAEVVDLVGMELSETLTPTEMDRLVVGDAAAAQTGADSSGIDDFLRVVDGATTETRRRNTEAPFAMHVEQIGDIPTRGLFAAGRVAQGKAEAGETLRVFTTGLKTDVVLKNLEIFRRTTPNLIVGDRGGAFLKRANKYVSIRRGSLLFHPSLDGWRASRSWKIACTLLPGQPSLPMSGHVILYHRAVSLAGDVQSIILSPGIEGVAEVVLLQEMMARHGDPVALRWEGVVVPGRVVIE